MPGSESGTTVNRRRQIRLAPEEQAAFLRDNPKCALATIDKDGFPHVVAMGFYVEDGAFWMTSYAKAQKVLNIRRNPKVGLMVETGASYAELRGVMVRGTCEIIEDVETVRRVMDHRRSRKRPARITRQRPQARRPQNYSGENRQLGPQQTRRALLMRRCFC